MRHAYRVLIGFAALTLVVVGVFVAYRLAAPANPHRPDFSLNDLAGTERAISDYDGEVVVLNFWASWCAPCRREIPMLVATQKELGPSGLQIVGVAIDTRAAAADFAARYSINYPVLADAVQGARIQDSYTEEGTPAGVLPYTAIIDRSGRVRARLAGALDRDALMHQIAPLLKQSGPAS